MLGSLQSEVCVGARVARTMRHDLTPGQVKSASRAEKWSMVASRLYFSKQYVAFYAVMIILSIVAMLMLLTEHYWGTSVYQVSPGLLVLEIALNVLLTLEIWVRFSAQRDGFWQSWYNVFDILVTFLCLVSIVCFLSIPEETKVEEFFASSVIAARYLIQIVRVVFLFRAGRTRRNMAKNSFGLEIEFSTLPRRASEADLFAAEIRSPSDSADFVSDDDEWPLSSFDMSRLGVVLGDRSSTSLTFTPLGTDDVGGIDREEEDSAA